MELYEKELTLNETQAGLLYELIDRVLGQFPFGFAGQKEEIGEVYTGDYQISLEGYNALNSVFHNLMKNEDMVYEQDGVLDVTALQKPSAGSDSIYIDEAQLEMMNRIVSAFIQQNNGLGECKLDLGDWKVDFADYEKLGDLLNKINRLR